MANSKLKDLLTSIPEIKPWSDFSPYAKQFSPKTLQRYSDRGWLISEPWYTLTRKGWQENQFKEKKIAIPFRSKNLAFARRRSQGFSQRKIYDLWTLEYLDRFFTWLDQ